MITEGNLVNYSGMALRLTEQHGPQTHFHDDPKGWKQQGSFNTPWRLIIVSPDLNGLVNTDMVTNVCPVSMPELANADWIKPGRSIYKVLPLLMKIPLKPIDPVSVTFTIREKLKGQRVIYWIKSSQGWSLMAKSRR